MKHFQFTSLLACIVMVSFFTSCGGDGSKEQTTTDSTSAGSSTTNAVIPEVNTIVASSQNMLLVKHKVADFAKWKMSYEEHDSMRLANGVHSYVIGRGVSDSNMVLVALKCDDLAKAKAFAKDPSLKQAMKKGGITGTPSVSFVMATWQDTGVINSSIRSSTTFTVKEWDTWQKTFDDGKQERIDNGVTVRVVGHDPDDNKKVSVVTAILDTAKANAYWKSDALKKRRTAAGVAGEPDRFMFRIAHRY